jgi:polar amino acid transport system ATP-binding protein
MLKIKDLSKSINHKLIISKLNLQVARGQIAVLLGASGVGKSTLLRILNNLEKFDSGQIELDGKLLDLTQANKTHVTGLVFQHFNLFENLTVLQNITLALEQVLKQPKELVQNTAVDLLKRYELLDKANLMVSQLSGGQKQRLAIARTLAVKPTVVCLDEPTSALDPLLTSYVAQNIKELSEQGYIVLVATHDISLLEKLPCTINLMQQGQIIASVQAHDFFADQNSYPALANFIAGK